MPSAGPALPRSVLIVGLHFKPETTGNAPYTSAMAQALANRGVSVNVITGVPHYPEWRVHDPYRRGLRWRESDGEIAITRLRHAVPVEPNLKGRLLLEATFFLQALPRVLLDRSDVVIAVSPTLSGLAAACLGRRSRPLGALVQDLNGNGAQESGVAPGRVAGAIEKVEFWLLRRPGLVGVIAPRFGDILSRRGKVDPRKIVDLPNFSHIRPVTSISQKESRRLLGWDPDSFLVVHTGNMGSKQGLDIVVRAAERADSESWKFVLVGDGNQRQRLESLAGDHSNVQFVAPLREELYPHALNAADVLLLTEKPGVREMSLPSKLTSYAVARRPIVASIELDGTSGELLFTCSGALVVPAGNDEALYRALADVRRDPAARAQLVQASERLLEHVGGRRPAEARYGRFAAALADPPAEASSFVTAGEPPADRGRTVLIYEGNGSGHRFSYVRMLADQGRARGLSVVVAASAEAMARPEFSVHLGNGCGHVEFITCPPQLSRVAALADEREARLVVIPDADRYLSQVATRGWRSRAQLSLLVMRYPTSLNLRQPKSWLKRALVAVSARRSRVDVSRLQSAAIAHQPGGRAVCDPVSFEMTEAAVKRALEIMPPGRFWFLIIGAVSARKNPVLVMEGLLRSGVPAAGLVVAGSIAPDVRREIDSALPRLEAAGIATVILDAILTDDDFDALVNAADCVVMAHSNDGPSGVLGKATAAGTRVLAAGAPSLARDCERLGQGALWTPLEVGELARGMAELAVRPRPRASSTATPEAFADKLFLGVRGLTGDSNPEIGSDG